MTSSSRIETYLSELSRALRGMTDRDREDITQEMRAHLEHRSSEGRLDEAMTSLGSAQACARAFMEELQLQQAFTDRSPARTFSTLLALGSQRVTAALGLFLSGVFFLFAAGFGFTAFFELVAPETAGLWSDDSTGAFFFGVIDDDLRPQTRDLLGRWLFPVAVSLALLSLLIGQALGRLFIRLLMRRPRALRSVP